MTRKILPLSPGYNGEGESVNQKASLSCESMELIVGFVKLGERSRYAEGLL
jgi:hypothetical protein